MKALRSFFSRLVGLLPSTRRERELDDELEAHLEMHIEDNLRAGMSPQDARREARMKLGGIEPTKQVVRERRSVPVLENTIQDVRFSIRQLRKNPGFTATAVFILALGICATISIFAFVDAALLKPLPYKDPTRLVGVFERLDFCHLCNISYLDFLDWKKMNKSFQSFDVYVQTQIMMDTPEGAKSAEGARVSDGFFRTLGVTPVLGRDFYTGESTPGAARTVLLTYRAWQTRYEGRPEALGKTITLNGEVHTIVGVLPREFHFAPAEPAEFWTPIHAVDGCLLRRSCHSLYGVARLKDGVTLESALADVKLIASQLEAQYPDTNRGQGANVQWLTEGIVGAIRPILLVLMGGAALLLMIATVNVTSLLLVRSESRRREISVRAALGASTARLAGQFVTEAVLLIAMGSVLGAIAAAWGMKVLLALIPSGMLSRMPYLLGIGFTARVSAFAVAIAVLAALLFAATPTLHFSLSRMRDGIAEGSRGSSGRNWNRVGSKLVVLELATAMVLLVGAGLLGKSLYRLLNVPLGIQPEHLVTMAFGAPKSYANDEKSLPLAKLVIAKIEALPGVKTVSTASTIPVSHWGNTTWVRVLGRPWHGEHLEMPERDISANYFETLGAQLERGRFFTESDDKSHPRVAIVNQAFVKQHFPGEDPIGKQLSYVTPVPVPITIIGIVKDIKEGGLDTENRAALYLPFNQNPANYFTLVVRTTQAPEPLIPLLAATIRQIDPGIVTLPAETMLTRINDSYSAYIHRSSAWLVGGFAALALLLGVVGLYGVVAYSVSQRTREIGVRMALGANRGSVYQLVLKEAGWLTVSGIAIGVACAMGGATLIRSLLFGVTTWDVPTLAIVAAVLCVASLAASYIPARRAASVNPVEALRAE